MLRVEVLLNVNPSVYDVSLHPVTHCICAISNQIALPFLMSIFPSLFLSSKTSLINIHYITIIIILYACHIAYHLIRLSLSFILIIILLYFHFIQAWSAITGEVVFNLRRQAQPVYSIAPSPTGELQF